MKRSSAISPPCSPEYAVAERPILTPVGTAARLATDWRGEHRAPEHAFLERLARNASRYELGAEHIFLAETLAALQPDLEAGDRRALVLLILASLVAMLQGSTYLPVRGEHGREALERALCTLLEAGFDPDQAALLAARDAEAIQHLLESGRLAQLVGLPGDHRPLILEGPHLYHQRLHTDEIALASTLAALLSRPSQARGAERDVQAALDALLDTEGGGFILLTPEQQYALLTALHAPFSIISGGPGTGKTSIVVSLLRMFFFLGLEVEQLALAAPTGKAARRLESSILVQLTAGSVTPLERRALSQIEPPMTLHRLLGFSPATRRFAYDATNPLPYRLIVVDEASMIDLSLMVRLTQSIGPHAQLVLLGDAEQLPSVSAGAVLRDLVPTAPRRDAPWAKLVRGNLEAFPHPAPPSLPMARACARIERSFRMDPRNPAGRNILMVARAIAAGDATRILAETTDDPSETLTLRTSADTLEHSGVELLPLAQQGQLDRELLAAVLDRWHTERIRGYVDHRLLTRHIFRPTVDGFSEDDRDILDAAFAHFDGFKILCLTRTGPLGTESTNTALHHLAVSGTGLSARVGFVPGEPVMMQRNDYGKKLWNGAQGLIVRVALDATQRAIGDTRSHRFMAVFPHEEDYAVFHLDSLRGDLELAYAITVHKAQGSEYDAIALMLPTEDMPLLTREMLYTAITRSRSSALLLGDPEMLRAGTHRSVERFSSVATRLASALEPEP